MATRFNGGKIVATQVAIEVIGFDDIKEALDRHFNYDWGELPEKDKQANDLAVIKGKDRIFSSYMSAGEKFYIITEADRSATTVLLADEY